MNEPIVWWSSLVLLSTLAIVLSVVIAARVLRDGERSWPTRVGMALVVPWGALATWREGKRALPVAWAVATVGYLGVRIAVAAIDFA